MIDEMHIDLEEIGYPPVAVSMGTASMYTKEGSKEFPIPIGTYGNFSFGTPPKTKKTFFVSLLGSVYLSGTNNFGGKMQGTEKMNVLCL